jgi:hypothetical protein
MINIHTLMTFILRVSAVLAASILAAASAHAATITGLAVDGSNNFQVPSSDFMGGLPAVSALVTSSSGHDVKSNRDQGQTFTVTETGTITEIAMFFESYTAGGTADFTFNFFEVASATDPTQVGATIDSLTVTDAMVSGLGFLDGDEGTLVFDVADTIVSAGSTYAIQLDTANDSSLILKWRRQNSDTYTDGINFGNGINGADYHVAAYGLVPEPSGFALLAGCFGLSWVMLRRRG